MKASLLYGGSMKILAILAVLTLSTQTFASNTIANTLAYTIAEAIYTTAVPVVSTGATTAMSDGNQKEAFQIKVDVQEYYQSGVISAALKNQINTAQKIDNTLSLEETLDALTEAANIILLP